MLRKLGILSLLVVTMGATPAAHALSVDAPTAVDYDPARTARVEPTIATVGGVTLVYSGHAVEKKHWDLTVPDTDSFTYGCEAASLVPNLATTTDPKCWLRRAGVDEARIGTTLYANGTPVFGTVQRATTLPKGEYEFCMYVVVWVNGSGLGKNSPYICRLLA